MRVGDVMGTDVLMTTRREPLVDVARRMQEGGVLASLVDPEAGERSAGILTARDVLTLVADGRDPRTTPVAEGFTPEAIAAHPDWTLERAAEAMVERRFRHLVVAEAGRTVGVVSLRDLVRAWTAHRRWPRTIQIQEAMTRDLLKCDGDDSVREAARRMVRERRGAAIVPTGGERAPPGIITEREILAMVAAGGLPDAERVAAHLSPRLTYSAPDWSLRQAAEAMIKGDFAHVIVVERTGTVGILSMREVLRRWLPREAGGPAPAGW